ncbi:MAG: hypothetical protein CMN72_00160 [Sphingomonas sp.]|mgnify:CR=1 FL=1|nr:hypothetical protein [Sphingomonas sp.]|tara:strand:+ start:153 stop:1142 length:990 start_codon:yes stop_codon:yes gene_type:complete
MRILKLCAVPIALLAAGCNLSGDSEPEITLEQACNADAEFCGKITADSRCRNERKDMIIARHKLMDTRDKQFAFDTLIKTEKFVKCAELAALIEYKDVKQKYAEKDKNRTEPLTDKEIMERERYAKSVAKRNNQKHSNYRHAEAELKKLQEWTSFSSIPELAYYQWSRHNDKEALKRLLDADEKGKANKAWLQFEISLHYGKISDEKTLNALHKSLILLDPEDYTPKDRTGREDKLSINDEGKFYFEAFRDLANIHFSKENYASAYVFATLLEINNDNTADLDFILRFIESKSRHKIPYLEDLAEELHDKLEDGNVTHKFLKKISSIKI